MRRIEQDRKFYQALTDALLAFAEREFTLSAPQDDGATLRDHLLILEKRTGERHELMAEAPPMPKGGDHVWGMFCEARSETPSDQRVTAAAMQSIEWANGIRLELWERQIIRALDWLYFKVRNGD